MYWPIGPQRLSQLTTMSAHVRCSLLPGRSDCRLEQGPLGNRKGSKTLLNILQSSNSCFLGFKLLADNVTDLGPVDLSDLNCIPAQKLFSVLSLHEDTQKKTHRLDPESFSRTQVPVSGMFSSRSYLSACCAVVPVQLVPVLVDCGHPAVAAAVGPGLPAPAG